jgi:hypothetical protein
MTKQEVKYLARPDDSEVFSRNANGTFSIESMKRDFPENLHSEYSQDTLERLGFKRITQEMIPACNRAKVKYHFTIAKKLWEGRGCGDD